MIFLFCLLFFFSGIAALLFETLWFYQAGLVLGNSIWASSLVLASFMGGLAIGNGLIGRFGHHARRPIQLYAVLEVTIGLTGLGIVHVLPKLTLWLTPLFRPFLDTPWILNPLRFATAFPLLLAPSAAMGATLPLLVGAMVRRESNFGRALGRLYGWNTLGAVGGALVGEFVLLQWFGVRGTAVVAACFNGLAALLAFSQLRRFDAQDTIARTPQLPLRLSKRAVSVLIVAFITGGSLLALEVVWFRLLQLFVVGMTRTFAIMLSVILAGIGAGGLLGARWISARPSAYRHLPTLALTSGVMCILAYLSLDRIAPAFKGLAAARWYEILAFCLPLMFPVSLLSGVLFTLLGDALHREVVSDIRSAGLLSLTNTVGAALGSLVAAFLFLPRVGIEGSIRLLAGSYGFAAVLSMFGEPRPLGQRAVAMRILLFGLLFLSSVFFPAGLMARRYVNYPIIRFSQREREMPVAIREGLTETIIYLRRDRFGEPMYYRLVTNNNSMSATMASSQRYMKLFVYLPVALHPQLKHALLISYGVGSTAKALTDTANIETIDVVDTSPDILDMSRIVFSDSYKYPLDDPRVTVHVEDGRFFLQTTDRLFDLITGEPPPPDLTGVVSLYTREYFDLLRTHLAEGGIVTYWFPAHSLSQRGGTAIIRAFCEVFTDCSLWGGAGLDWILMGTHNAQGPRTDEHFARQWADPIVGPELRALCLEVPEQLGALFFADADDLRELSGDIPSLSDNYPKRLSSELSRRKQARVTYASWMDARVARQRFLRSEIVSRLWPRAMQEASGPYFEVEESLARFIAGEIHDPVAILQAAHRVLSHSSLRTSVLWFLSSGVKEQQGVDAALSKGSYGPDLDYQLGVRALVNHDYLLAEQYFRLALQYPTTQRDVLYLQLYTLCMAGRLEEAKVLIRQSGLPHGKDEADQRFLAFLSETFALGNPPHLAFWDGIGNGLGYGAVLVTVAFIRELLGSGKIFGYNVIPEGVYAAGYENMGFMLLAPAAFIIIGLLVWLQKRRAGISPAVMMFLIVLNADCVVISVQPSAI